LDPALIRPGRIDRQLDIGFANQDQCRRMFLRFFPDADPATVDYFVTTVPDRELTMSAVQTFLIEHSESADEACAALEDWLARQRSAGQARVRGHEPALATAGRGKKQKRS
jgi:hypothetical protein